MRILITGATGFIAAQLAASLHQTGHHIVAAVRDVASAQSRLWYADVIFCDFYQDTDPAVWRQRLQTQRIDVVINCVGILQDGNSQQMQAIHRDAPIALFKACQQAGVKRVLQISALGAGESDTAYAQTKQAADEFLLSMDSLSRLVIRPSVVFASGAYGGTALFRGLSALPGVIPLVGNGEQKMAPIALTDLANAICHYIESPERSGEIIYAVGPEQISLKNLLALIRQWLGLGRARFISIPTAIIKPITKCLSVFSKGPINQTSLTMLSQGNVHDAAPFQATVPFKVSGISEAFAAMPSQTQDRWHAKLYFCRPLLRWALILLWLFSGVVPLLNAAEANAYLSEIGLPNAWLDITRVMLSSVDIAIALMLIARWKVKYLGWLQLACVTIYTLVATCTLAYLWWHPLAPLLKNVPIMVAVVISMILEDQR